MKTMRDDAPLPANGAQARITPALAGIPETLLWTLYARASSSASATPLLHDPEAVRICAAIDYDFATRFGAPNPLFALRAALMDGAAKTWLARNPEGTIVSLGEGLETQAFRIDNGRMAWISVDLPEAIRLRELFIAPGGRFTHLAISATDPAWMEAVGAGPVLVIAQGLFMYLQPEEVRHILTGIAARFPGAEILFDVVPRALSDSTLRGHLQSETYALPAMPWGLRKDEILPTLRHWKLPIARADFLPYRLGRMPAWAVSVLDRLQPARLDRVDRPSLVHLTLRG